MILIDGDHTTQATRDDLEGVLPLAGPSATILIHDAFNSDVRRAIDDFISAHADCITDVGMICDEANAVSSPQWKDRWGGLYMLRRGDGDRREDGDG